MFDVSFRGTIWHTGSTTHQACSRVAGRLQSAQKSHGKAGTVDGESIPVLLLAAGKSNTMFYDLSVLPPVERVVASSEFRVSREGGWDHSSVVHAYTDAEMSAVLAYLRDVMATDKN